MIAVVGTPRSGSSCMAGMLHKLGVSMGRKFIKPNKNNPKGFYEAVGLTRLCRDSYIRPAMVEKNTRADRVHLLRTWKLKRQKAGSVIGAKHSRLCFMLSELLEVWPGLKVITTDRPLADVLASMKKISWWKRMPEATREETLRLMLDRRDADLVSLNIPTLRLPFADMIRDPAAAVDVMIAFCGITPTAEQHAAAIAHVDPDLQHHGKAQ